MAQKIRSDFHEDMINTLKKFQDAQPPPTLPTPPTPATTTTGATWRPTTFQHSTVTCPTSSLPLTSPHHTTLRILSSVWTNDLSPAIAFHLIDVPSRLIPCGVIDNRLTHAFTALSGYDPGREHPLHLDNLGMNTTTDGNPNPIPLLTLVMPGPIPRTPVTIRTNNMAGILLNTTDGNNPVTMAIMVTTIHSPNKSVSMRHSPLPSQSPLQLTPLRTLQHHPKGKKKLSRTSYTSLCTLRSQASPRARSLIVPLHEGEFYLTHLDSSHEEWISQVQFALNHKSRIPAACELFEDKHPGPLTTVNKALLESATHTLGQPGLS